MCTGRGVYKMKHGEIILIPFSVICKGSCGNSMLHPHQTIYDIVCASLFTYLVIALAYIFTALSGAQKHPDFTPTGYIRRTVTKEEDCYSHISKPDCSQLNCPNSFESTCLLDLTSYLAHPHKNFSSSSSSSSLSTFQAHW